MCLCVCYKSRLWLKMVFIVCCLFSSLFIIRDNLSGSNVLQMKQNSFVIQSVYIIDCRKVSYVFWHSFKNTIIANFYCILLKTPGTELLLLNETNGNKYPKIPSIKTTQRIHFSIELIDEKNKKKLERKINDWIHNLILKLSFSNLAVDDHSKVFQKRKYVIGSNKMKASHTERKNFS